VLDCAGRAMADGAVHAATDVVGHYATRLHYIQASLNHRSLFGVGVAQSLATRMRMRIAMGMTFGKDSWTLCRWMTTIGIYREGLPIEDHDSRHFNFISLVEIQVCGNQE
jgi:hypothetical protein